MSEYQEAKLCRLDIRVNNDPVDAFSSIVHVDKAEGRDDYFVKDLKTFYQDSYSKLLFKPVSALK